MKYARLIGAAAATALLMTSCAGGGEPEADSGVVELSLWTGFTGGDRHAYEELVETFNQTHDDIQVKMEVQPWDTIAQKLPAAWATGQGPDLATPSFDPNVLGHYVETDALAPIVTGDSGVDAENIVQSAIDVFTYDENLYAVPANVATLQLYYNKQIFEEFGIEEAPKTIEELRDVLANFTDGDTYGLALAERDTIQMWPVLHWLEGADIVGDDFCAVIDSEESQSALTTWQKLAESGAVPTGLSGAESDSLFSAGKAAMQINGPWAAAGYEEAGIDLGVASIPVGVDGEATLASTAPLSISARSSHPEEAQEFAAWWVSQDAQRQFALSSGFPPVRTDMADDEELAENEVVASFASALDSSRLYLPNVPNASQVDNEAYVPLIASITRGADVAEATEKAADTINRLTGCN